MWAGLVAEDKYAYDLMRGASDPTSTMHIPAHETEEHTCSSVCRCS